MVNYVNCTLSRDELFLFATVKTGVNVICDAIQDMLFKRVLVVCAGDASAWGLPQLWNELAEHGRRKFYERCVPAITGAGIFKSIHMHNQQKVSWHLPRLEDVKTMMQEFIENIAQLLNHFSYKTSNSTKMSDVVMKDRERCQDSDSWSLERAEQETQRRREKKRRNCEEFTDQRAAD
eukprot:5437016-Amphidinium_carterae.1